MVPLNSRGLFLEAETLARSALSIEELSLGPTDRLTLLSMRNLAEALNALGRPQVIPGEERSVRHVQLNP